MEKELVLENFQIDNTEAMVKKCELLKENSMIVCYKIEENSLYIKPIIAPDFIDIQIFKRRIKR